MSPERSERSLHTTRTAFQDLLRAARRLQARRLYGEAAMCAQIAAEYASHNHPGLFASSELEQLLLDIGTRTVVPGRDGSGASRSGPSPAAVLHVLTKASIIGGTTRNTERWVLEDPGRRHSVAVTRQNGVAIPPSLLETVERTGGRVHVLDSGTSDPIARARALRTIAEGVDQVLIAPIPYDVVPLLAFAAKRNCPPVALVDHCDHMFWVGPSVCDVVVHLRDAGRRLGQARRGISPARQVVVPIPVVPVTRTLSREEAKKALGYSPDTTILLTIGRRYKYMTTRRPGFFEAVVPVLERHKNAVLIAFGPNGSDPWIVRTPTTADRILTMGERCDTQVYYQAADIYLDSFAFAGNTSLLEAGNYGIPLVTYGQYPDDADVLHAGAPGFDPGLIRVKSQQEFETILDRLIADPESRQRTGEAARRNILDTHSGGRLTQSFREAYSKAASVPPLTTRVPERDSYADADLDVALNQLGAGFGVRGIIEDHARSLPFMMRVRLLMALRAVESGFSREMFVPDWVAQSRRHLQAANVLRPLTALLSGRS